MAPHRGRCSLLSTMAGWLLSQPTDALFLWRAPPCRRLGSADIRLICLSRCCGESRLDDIGARLSSFESSPKDRSRADQKKKRPMIRWLVVVWLPIYFLLRHNIYKIVIYRNPIDPILLRHSFWLVVWNMFYFSHILGIPIPTDFHILQRD